jgi:amino acid adenylation domain-containing protein
MNTFELLEQLKKRKIALWEEAGSLKFRAPPGALDEALKAEIRNHKPVLMRLLEKTSTGKPDQSIPVASRKQTIPASFPQRRLWLLDQLDDASNPAFNQPHIFKFDGRLDEEILRKSLEAIIDRHEALRTAIQNDGNAPFQVIKPGIQLDLPLIKLTRSQTGDHLGEIQEITKQLSKEPFDFAKAPLIRTRLVRTSPTEHWLIFIIHHIAFDGWSRSLFKKELSAFYTAFTSGTNPDLPELKIQYADYAAWQHSVRFKSQLEYWKKTLADAEFNLDLSFARTGEQAPSYEGDQIEFEVSTETTAGLSKIGEETGSTQFMVLLAAYALLLNRYTTQSDFVVGVPVANRTRPEVENLIGFFLNTLILKCKITGKETFRELLQQVQRTALAAFDNQDIPVEAVLWDLLPDRDPNFSSLLQVTFQLQNMPRHDLQLPGLTVSSVPVRDIQTQVALDLVMAEDPDKDLLRGSLFYQKSRFPKTTMIRMATHLQAMLCSIIKNPDMPVAKLSYISESEKQELHQRAIQNATCVFHTPDIVSCIEQQAKRIPGKTAVESASRQLSYRELNERSNQLAHWLRKEGVGADCIVGMCMARSPEVIIAILGILKAGGAYLPMDPGNPDERLADMLEDSKTRILLTTTDLVRRFPDFGGRALCLDDHQNKLAQEGTSNPEPTGAEDDLAVVIYTSGSTGQPKGVMISHRALQHFTGVISDYYGISESDRVLQFASLSFDTSSEEILTSLTRGATIVLRTDEMVSSSEAFWSHCMASQLTVLDLPTAFWHQLTSSLGTSPKTWPASLRLVVIGGESARPDAVNRWSEYAPAGVRLINTYGPTESTVVATAFEISDRISGKTVPIGQPIGGMRAYILDQNLQLVGDGLPGELCLAGATLARGYLHRKDLTAEKFTEFHEDGLSGEGVRERIYRTGDRARYNQNGEIEFLGRLDNQVKIRGFRVEMGEIEALLRKHPSIADCVVTTTEDTAGSLLLVAYFVPRVDPGRPASSEADLKEHLKTRLPDFMIPSIFVEIPEIPVTLNGKVDIRALPDPQRRSDEKTDTAPPQGTTETVVAEVWMEAFRLEQIDRDTDFFKLDGHSILAMKIIDRIEQRLGKRARIADLFNHPVLHEFARTIQE